MRRGPAIIACTALLGIFGCPGGGGDSTDDGPDPDTGPSGSTGMMTDSSGTTAPETISLARAEAWTLASAEDDPFAGERPMFVQCEIGWDVVTGGFQVDTGVCTYAAFAQPMLASIEVGDEVEVLITRTEPSQPGVGHAGIAFGAEIVFETDLPASDEGDISARWEATADVSVGTPLHLHLHDDGGNTYRIGTIAVTKP